MKAPPGALTTIEDIQKAFDRGVRVLYLSPAANPSTPWKFKILDAKLTRPHGYWIIEKAYNETLSSPFDNGVTAFCIPSDRRDQWWWFANYWEAWAATLHWQKQQEKK